MRIILFTGKGGVGKTSMAAATALRSAELGYKTIILSTDAAHSLSDSFDTSLGNEPRQIVPNLWGQETELYQFEEAQWGILRRHLAALFAWRGIDEVVAEEMAVLPGMEELANLLYILRYYDEGKYDVIVLDCAPTGETMRLLGFPEVAHWWMTRLFPIQRKLARAVRPIAKVLTDFPWPEEEVLTSIQELFSDFERVQALLTDAEKTSVRLVVNAEKMVIKEAQRAFTYFNLYGYFTDLIICNRLIPDKVEDSHFRAWKESQKKYHQLIEEGFAPLPILDVPLLKREVVGLPMLKILAETLYNEDDPTKLFFQGQAQSIQRLDGHYVLTLALPFAGKGKISLIQDGDELTIQVASFRRNVILPRALRGLAVTEAKLDEGKLEVRFDRAKPGDTK